MERSKVKYYTFESKDEEGVVLLTRVLLLARFNLFCMLLIAKFADYKIKYILDSI